MYVDMHAHILPCADHGSDGLETSRRQIEMAVSAGVDTILATPHFYMHKDTVDEFLHRREESAEALKKLLPVNEEPPVSVFMGAEVALEVGIDEMSGIEKLCMGGTSNILVELPLDVWTPWVYNALERIKYSRGLNPIIAHADRYIAKNSLDGLTDMGLPFQINASALTGISTKRKMLKLFGSGAAMYLGSDIHMTGREYTDYAKAAKVLGGMMGKITEYSRDAVGQNI